MEIKYFDDTDTLLVTFNNNEVAVTEDLSENVLMDLDLKGNPVALTIEHARTFTNVHAFSFQRVQHNLNKVSTDQQGV